MREKQQLEQGWQLTPVTTSRNRGPLKANHEASFESKVLSRLASLVF